MNTPTKSTDSPSLAERGLATAELLNLVSDMRELRANASARRGSLVPFVEIADRIAGANPSPAYRDFLQALGALLDQPDAALVDAELDRLWRKAVRSWQQEAD